MTVRQCTRFTGGSARCSSPPARNDSQKQMGLSEGLTLSDEYQPPQPGQTQFTWTSASLPQCPFAGTGWGLLCFTSPHHPAQCQAGAVGSGAHSLTQLSPGTKHSPAAPGGPSPGPRASHLPTLSPLPPVTHPEAPALPK